MGIEVLKPHIEAARQAAERAHQHVQATLDELEAAREGAEAQQLTAEYGQRVANAARQAAEAAQEAAEAAQVVAEAAVSEAERSHRSLQEFMAMAAHDIKGPLAAIAGFADLLDEAEAEPEDRTFAVDAIQAAVRQMDRLTDDIVDAGRLGAGTFRMRPEPMDLVELVQRAVRGQQATTDRHRFVVDTPERLDGAWDPDRLGQVMTNLISNAVKYSPTGGDIEITVRREPEAATVTVTDHGRGISHTDLPSLFRPFRRLLSSEERYAVAGTGLGLYISQGIVRAHGGHITATSDGQDFGSAFTVHLPLRRRSPVADARPE
jgi:signal transduction histidine kinase